MLCTAAVARAQDAAPAAPAPTSDGDTTSPWLFHAAVGGALEARGYKLAAVDLDVGALLAPRIALGAELTVQGTPTEAIGVVGPQVQFWPTGALWLSVGGGLAFIGGGSRAITNTAVVSSASAETYPTDNTASVTTTVGP